MDKSSRGNKGISIENLFLQFSKIQFLERTRKPGLESRRTWLRKIKRNAKEGSSSLSSLPLPPGWRHLPWDNGSRSRSCTGTTCCPGNRKTVSLWSVSGSRRSNRRPVYCRSARTIKPCWNRTPPLKWNEQPLYRDNLIFWYFVDVGEVWKMMARWFIQFKVKERKTVRNFLEIFRSKIRGTCKRM